MKKCQRKVNKWNRPWYGPHRAHNQLKWWLRDSRGLYSAPQSFTVTLSPLPSHQSSMMDPDHSYGSPMGWEKAASRLQTTQNFFILAVKFDSVLMYLCVCDNKLNFLSWAIRPVFADPVKFMVSMKTLPHRQCCQIVRKKIFWLILEWWFGYIETPANHAP